MTGHPRKVSTARRLRVEATTPERVLWSRLKGRALHGWKFRRQHPFGPFVLDFVCLEAKLAIEIDGAAHFEPDAVARDRRRQAWIEREGLSVFRVTASALATDLDAVVAAISAALGEPSKL